MFNIRNIILLVLTAFIYTSCTPTDNSSSYQPTKLNSANHIIGGTTVENNLHTGKYVVGMFAPRFGNCSGVIIAEDLILTAAHCIPPNPRSLTIIFDSNLNNAHQKNMRPVISATVSPYWIANSKNPKNKGDLAVVKFQGPIPNGYKQAYMLTNSAYIADRSFTLLAGFGVSSTSQIDNSSGVLRETFTSITQAKYSATEALINQLGGRGTCSGDSGGPAFILINGTYYLWGITSQGDAECRNYGIYTNIVPYLKWIQQTAQVL